MRDRVYPSAKPNGRTTTGSTNPPPKSQLYNPTGNPYRPQPNHNSRRRSRRSCLCLCCFWSVLALTALLLLAAIAGCVVYVLYSPHRPEFSVDALKISQFNLSTNAADYSTHLTSTLNVTISAGNQNRKLIYFFDQFVITALSNQVQIANGSFPRFTSNTKNTTVIRSTLSTSAVIDADKASSLRSVLKRRNGLPLEIVMETKVVGKLENLKSKKLGIVITCDGIRGFVPQGKTPTVALISNAKCNLRIKIWGRTF